MAVNYEVTGLVHEREGRVRVGDDETVKLIDEQLRLRGYAVDADGNLVEYVEPKRPAKKAAPAKEKAVKEPAPERAVND